MALKLTCSVKQRLLLPSSATYRLPAAVIQLLMLTLCALEILILFLLTKRLMLQDSVESLQSNRESLEEKLSLLVIGIIIIMRRPPP